MENGYSSYSSYSGYGGYGKDRADGRERGFSVWVLTFVALAAMEALFRAFTVGFGETGYLALDILISLLVCASLASLLYFLRCLPRLCGPALYTVFMILLIILFLAQVVYYRIFATFFTFYSLLHGAQVTEFMGTIWDAIWSVKLQMLALLAVGAAAIALAWRRGRRPRSPRSLRLVVAGLLCLLFLGLSLLIGSVEDDDPNSPYQALYGVGEIKPSVRCAGLMGAMGIDVWKFMTGFEPDIEEIPEEVVEIEPQPDDNVIRGLDFEDLAAAEEDETLRNMDLYFGSLEPTAQNEQTGIFKGKNLIFITAESFTDFAIDPKYTPTLYKLLTEGYNFTNFYNPIWGVSTLDGEYVNLQSLVPKPGVWSMKESAENWLPFTLGNQLSKLGYEAKAYHNHSVYYYDRVSSHPNLGYDFKGQGREYNFENIWPESDLEMIDETTADFLTADEDGEIEPFHVYYLTVSGHLNYNFYGNMIAYRNRELVQDMDMSDACKAYMAGEIELDRALELLLARLDEAGVLENTVIALAGDHYPYGLTSEEISEFRGHEVDEEYELYKSAFLLWTPGMEPQTVDKLCSTMDILPTLSNMFALTYDSRLLMGRDIFSEAEGFVVFKDKNWISERGTRSRLLAAEDGKGAGANSESNESYVEEMDRRAARMFNFSALILDRDYYRHLAEKSGLAALGGEK